MTEHDLIFINIGAWLIVGCYLFGRFVAWIAWQITWYRRGKQK